MILPPNILRCMSPEDRKSLGKGGLLPEEALARAQIKNERDLQKQIKSYLELKGIVVFDQRMDKRTRGRKGQPDFLFALNGLAIAWEVKMPGEKLSGEQIELCLRLGERPNAWWWSVIHSVNEAISIFKEIETFTAAHGESGITPESLGGSSHDPQRECAAVA